MNIKTVPKLSEILAIVMILAVSMTGLTYRNLSHSAESDSSGKFIVPASAMEASTVEKEVGDIVQVKVKVKNTGNAETSYLIVVKWKEHGSEGWEHSLIEDIALSPGESELVVLGNVECSEAMMGKHFDVKLLLYEAEKERLLDEKEMLKAWYVKETIITGSIAEYWIE